MTKPRSPTPDRTTSRAAFRVGAGIFLSRIAGLVRDTLVGFFFGVGIVSDVWAMAIRIPNVIQTLLGEGTLSASLVPVYAEMLEEGREEDAGRFAGAAFGLVTAVVWGIALIGILSAPWLAAWLGGFGDGFSPEQQTLLATLLRILFPMVALIAMSAWGLAILNSHRRFFVSYIGPALWNISMITALVVFGFGVGWGTAERSFDLIEALAWGALVGGGLQFFVQLPWLRSSVPRFRPALSTRVTGMREAIRNFLPVVAARGVGALGGLVDFLIAIVLTTGALSGLYFAQRLYLLPISLFGLSFAAAELPEMSRDRKAASEVLAGRVARGMERVAFFVVPVTTAYLAFGDLVIGTIYQRGAFGVDSTAVVYVVLAAYALGIPATATSRLLSSAFYAVRDTRTPAVLSVMRLIVSVSVGISLMLPLDRLGSGELRFGAAGLALGASLAAWMEYVVLRRKLAGHIGPHRADGRFMRTVVVGSVVAGLCALGAKAVLASGFPVRDGIVGAVFGEALPWLVLPVSLLGTGLVFGVVFLAIVHRAGIEAPLPSIAKRPTCAEIP